MCNKVVCYECGEEFDKEDMIENYGGYHYCKECAEAELFQCVECGEWFDKEDMIEDYQGNCYCKECAEAELFQCDECGEWYPEYKHNSARDCNNNEIDVCDDCLYREDYERCDECGDYYRKEDMSYIENTHEYVCNSCFEYYEYFTCEECGDNYSCGCLNRDRYGDIVCDDCYEEEENITEYHEWDGNFEPVYDNNEPLSIGKTLTYGFEIEAEYLSGKADAIAGEILESVGDLVHFETDGSLEGQSFECITQPMSLKYIQNSGKLKKIYTILQDYEAKYTHCGLHCHIGKEALKEYGDVDEIINNLVLITEHFSTELFEFSRRGSAELSSYCSFLFNTHKEVSKSKIKKKISLRERYQVININNYNTIEIRIFKGTDNYETFVACAEMADSLIHKAIELANGTIKTLSWNDIITHNEYKYLEKENNLLGITQLGITQVVEDLNLYYYDSKENV